MSQNITMKLITYVFNQCACITDKKNKTLKNKYIVLFKSLLKISPYTVYFIDYTCFSIYFLCGEINVGSK